MVKVKAKSTAKFFAVLTILFITLTLPAILPIQNIEQKQATAASNNNQAKLATTVTIFNNNMLIGVITLIPGVGWGYLLAVIWQTGVVIASYQQAWWYVLNNPFAWIELSVYSYIILQSLKILHLIPQRKANDYWPTTIRIIAKAFIVMTIALLVSALIEYSFIRGMV